MNKIIFILICSLSLLFATQASASCCDHNSIEDHKTSVGKAHVQAELHSLHTELSKDDTHGHCPCEDGNCTDDHECHCHFHVPVVADISLFYEIRFPVVIPEAQVNHYADQFIPFVYFEDIWQPPKSI